MNSGGAEKNKRQKKPNSAGCLQIFALHLALGTPPFGLAPSRLDGILKASIRQKR